jgi:flagella synthesis protein FlgN
MNTNANNPQPANDMHQLLGKIATASTALLQCLNKEHEALSLNQLDTLIPLAEQKQQLVSQLDQLDQQRQSSCQRVDFITHLNNLDANLAANWQSVTQTIKKCQQQNEVNGRLLNRRNALAKETLEIFTGRKLNDSHTYGADGLQTGSASIVTNVKV